MPIVVNEAACKAGMLDPRKVRDLTTRLDDLLTEFDHMDVTLEVDGTANARVRMNYPAAGHEVIAKITT
jgi:hypothetical protein